MSLLEQLSSKSGERSEDSNKKVAAECLQDSSLLAEIVANLNSRNAKLAGDCAEVCTMVAQSRPELIAPYGEALCAIRTHPFTRARWEVAHSLALIAPLRTDLIAGLIPDLMDSIRTDGSIVVRDYTIDILANFSSTGESAALQAFPALIEALTIWNSRHTGHALAGLEHTARFLPDLRSQIRAIVQPYLASDKLAIRKAAKRVCKASS